MEVTVKQELIDSISTNQPTQGNNSTPKTPAVLIDLSSSSSSSSSSDSDSDDEEIGNAGGIRVSSAARKKRKLDALGVALPAGFLAPLPPSPPPAAAAEASSHSRENGNGSTNLGRRNKQFWKAGDYEGSPAGDWNLTSAGMDHVRVHPKFLHSNATSHKWALGAFAELLDNALDEVCNGATYVNVDMLESRKDGSRMLLIEDNGGGMDPDKMRKCMSLGYSAKSKLANTIGQYGNGFKTSTMRLGADVLVFSRCRGKDNMSPTQSIGLLSYTFLTSTGKEDIVVPMLDFEKKGREWNVMTRFSTADWNRNLETIVQWSPFSNEAELLRQFNVMSDHGTRVIIYNLWEDDQGYLELDFDTDPHDIQLRGVNRDEKNIQMAREFPNSRHFLTYRHSLRSYASILYLRLPPGFRIILRGKDVDHHNIVNDMMLSQEITYRPQGSDGVPKDSTMAAVVTIGFVKDAKHHIDVQGFNVYHKNRLIKPFWRLWNAAGSDGRGVIGVLEANFVEPAHDKQGFERTTVLARLESRLVQMQKNYWSTQCHKIGYAPRRNKKAMDEYADRGSSPDNYEDTPVQSRKSGRSMGAPNSDKFSSYGGPSGGKDSDKSTRNGNYGYVNRQGSAKGTEARKTAASKSGRKPMSLDSSPPPLDVSDDDIHMSPTSTQDQLNRTRLSSSVVDTAQESNTRPQAGGDDRYQRDLSEAYMRTIDQLKEENRVLKDRLEVRKAADTRGDLIQRMNCDKCKSLEIQLQEAQKKIEELNMEQESLINIFSEERERREEEEENLRKKSKEASNTIQQLLEKVRILEKMKTTNYRSER